MKTHPLRLGIAALLMAIGSASPFAHANPFSDTPGTSVHYHAIEGCTGVEIRRALNEKGPTDQFGRRRDAYTSWHVWWTWPLGPNNQPDYSKTTKHQEINVHLPEWNAKSCEHSKDLNTRWKSFLEAIIRHEKRHVEFVSTESQRIAAEIRETFRRRPQLTVHEANAIGQKVLWDIREKDRKYDEESESGRSEGVVFP